MADISISTVAGNILASYDHNGDGRIDLAGSRQDDLQAYWGGTGSDAFGRDERVSYDGDGYYSLDALVRTVAKVEGKRPEDLERLDRADIEAALRTYDQDGKGSLADGGLLGKASGAPLPRFMTDNFTRLQPTDAEQTQHDAALRQQERAHPRSFGQKVKDLLNALFGI